MTKKITGALLLSLSIHAHTSAQTILKSNVHIGLAYPISTNGVRAAEYTNAFSLHAISGVSYSETAFCASGVASIIKDSAQGFVGSGFINIIGNKATGVQAAGFMNCTRNQSKGLQAAGFLNLSGDLLGTQAGGFANVCSGNVTGLQVAGFTNTARNANVQVAGFINVSDTNLAQIAGFINVARHAKGAQVAGFANIAGDVDGSQVAGFINVAGKVKGVQLSGFINIADSSDYPIGIINLIKNGEKYIGIMVDETGTTFATFRSGGRRLYGILGVGYNGSHYRSIYATQAGIGAHWPISASFRISAEATATSLTDFRRSTDMESSIKLIPSFRLWHMEFFAGPSIGYALSHGPGSAPFDHHSFWTEKVSCYTHEWYIGGQAGLQLRF